jgi:excisionase family DNA binding protein
MARSVPRDLIPLTEAGTLVGLNRQTVRRMISRGHLAGYRVGVASNAPVLVSRAEVLSLVEPIPAAGH